jgi:hypothetical protein
VYGSLCDHPCGTLLLYLPLDPGLRISNFVSELWSYGDLNPGLLHAISRQHVHSSTYVQASVSGRPYQSPRIHAGCGTFLLYSPRLPRQEPADVAVPPATRIRIPGNSGPSARIDFSEECLKPVDLAGKA